MKMVVGSNKTDGGIMMRIKKILLLPMLTIAMMCILPAVHAEAEETVEVVVATTEGNVGDRIDIPIVLNNSSSVGGMDFTVVYDPEELQYVKALRGDSAKEANLCDINHLSGTSAIRYVYASLNAMPQDGEILIMTFKVLKDNAEDHTVNVEMKDMLNLEIEEIPYNVIGGREIEPSTVDVFKNDDTSSEMPSVNIYGEDIRAELEKKEEIKEDSADSEKTKTTVDAQLDIVEMRENNPAKKYVLICGTAVAVIVMLAIIRLKKKDSVV